MAGVFCRRIIASTSTDHWVYYRYCVSDAIYRFRVENVCVLHLHTSCIVFNRELNAKQNVVAGELTLTASWMMSL